MTPGQRVTIGAVGTMLGAVAVSVGLAISPKPMPITASSAAPIATIPPPNFDRPVPSNLPTFYHEPIHKFRPVKDKR